MNHHGGFVSNNEGLEITQKSINRRLVSYPYLDFQKNASQLLKNQVELCMGKCNKLQESKVKTMCGTVSTVSSYKCDKTEIQTHSYKLLSFQMIFQRRNGKQVAGFLCREVGGQCVIFNTDPFVHLKFFYFVHNFHVTQNPNIRVSY